MKIAILSNVNMNSVIRILKRETEVYDMEGYGNELGLMLNPTSSLNNYDPEQIFLIEDIMELTNHELALSKIAGYIEQWFVEFEAAAKSSVTYHISDVFCYGPEINVLVDVGLKEEIEGLWLSNLRNLISRHNNIRIFPYKSLIEKMGTSASFSTKMWYMGKIMHSTDMQHLIAKEILKRASLENVTPKKVLIVDLDNTLWGGLAGEDDITPIILSEEHLGLAYKNLQRVILQMKRQGVLLGIVSKNNEEDANNIIDNHPHMVLRSSDFAVKKITWENKAKCIEEISHELNLGLDSIVYFDDNPTERQLVKDLLPQVIVPDFPERPEDLSSAMVEIWNNYFLRPIITEEDSKKTEQYIANFKREELKISSASFDDYLSNLNIILTRKCVNGHVERVTQLLNKTNQFNLTTKRHSQSEIQNMIDGDTYEVIPYQSMDRFGDNGIIAVVVLNVAEQTPIIEEFVMSCRVMGKKIEDAIIEDIEQHLISRGFDSAKARYVPTAKNKPVSELYSSLGYKMVFSDSKVKEYWISLDNRPERDYCLEKNIEE